LQNAKKGRILFQMGRRALRALLVAVPLLGASAAVGGLWWARAQMRASLPQVDGTRPLPGLSGPVTVTRDARGVPTVTGRTREDVARATGFLHAQDRFFQMDLARRRAAGELSALVGRAALAVDRETRIHRFRAEAERAVSMMNDRNRALLDAYTAGVNAGLDALAAAPFEYFVLRQDPRPWRPEDTLLVVLSMFITLQDADGSYEETLGTMSDVLPQEVFAFLTPAGTEWDTPVVGERFTVPAIPPSGVYNLRERRRGRPRRSVQPPPAVASSRTSPGRWGWPHGVDAEEAAVGSNSFAVAGSLTTDGGALVANDMHLTVRVPNTWYRAVLEWQEPSGGGPRRIIGVTLPGTPAVVAGSNTHVAWGFTNTYADWGDLVLLEIDPSNPTRYRTPGGWRELDRHVETIEVAGEDEPHRETVMWTIWGPVLRPDHRGRQRAYRWVAHAADRLAGTMAPLEDARTIEQAFDEVNGLGTPGQNIIVADRSGRIGWSIYGSIPRRIGLDGRLPASWADGSRGWSGWLERSAYPRIVDPSGGRLWTANARVVDGEMLARLGDGSYEVGSRARIIRDRLMRKERFAPRDLLEIQLETGADFLARWRELLLQTLTAAAVSGKPERAEVRRLVRTGWDGRASPDSAGYRFTRMFRDEVSERVITFVLAECYEADPRFRHTTLRRREGPIWKIVSERPMHLLDPAYRSWDDLLLDAIDDIVEEVSPDGELAGRVWSEYNITAYRHPLSPSLPFIGRLLDMPRHPLPGDLYTPRMHWGAIAASERMVVSPGHEERGIFHMPTGQSGHPLSPFYANSHDAWVNGEPTPFLPGPAVHTLTLTQ
jgi:penicillin amidase